MLAWPTPDQKVISQESMHRRCGHTARVLWSAVAVCPRTRYAANQELLELGSDFSYRFPCNLSRVGARVISRQRDLRERSDSLGSFRAQCQWPRPHRFPGNARVRGPQPAQRAGWHQAVAGQAVDPVERCVTGSIKKIFHHSGDRSRILGRAEMGRSAAGMSTV